LKVEESLVKENYNIIEKLFFFEELEVGGDQFCGVGLSLCFVLGVGGVGSLCCTWAKFFRIRV